jgi:hypothetical protein
VHGHAASSRWGLNSAPDVLAKRCEFVHLVSQIARSRLESRSRVNGYNGKCIVGQCIFSCGKKEIRRSSGWKE